MQSLPSFHRLLIICVLLPTAIAATNQATFELLPRFDSFRFWMYPWMAMSAAVLSWCTGRFLFPAWLRWLVFGWCVTLLVSLTFAACISGRIERHLGYVLVSALVSFIVLWAILANVKWQWRLPVALMSGAAIALYSGSFDSRWTSKDWNLLLVVTTTVVAMVCLLLRLRSYVLVSDVHKADASNDTVLGTGQFGLKHILLWSTALAPILVVARGLDLLIVRRLGAPDLLPFGAVAVAVAAVNLIAIWAVLGEGRILYRLVAILVVPYLLAVGLNRYLDYVESSYRVVRIAGIGQMSRVTLLPGWYNSLVSRISDSNDSWASWLWLDAALLASLLLFLRASRYRLVRRIRAAT